MTNCEKAVIKNLISFLSTAEVYWRISDRVMEDDLVLEDGGVDEDDLFKTCRKVSDKLIKCLKEIKEV